MSFVVSLYVDIAIFMKSYEKLDYFLSYLFLISQCLLEPSKFQNFKN